MLFSTLFFGQTIHVPADFPSIQEAIDAANPNDTVLVDPGIYYEHIIVPDKALVIGSLFLTTQDTDYIDQTIIDGSNNGRVIYIVGTDEFITLSGFTIQNGNISGYSYGGGIFIQGGNNTTLTDLIVKSNTATEGGGLGVLWYSSATIINTTFYNNQGIDDQVNYIEGCGGAVYARSAQLTFVNCHFDSNSASLGGAIGEVDGNHAYHQCTFQSNNADLFGEAIVSFDTQKSTFYDCEFTNHPIGTVFYPWGGNLTFNNCLIANNNIILSSHQYGDTITFLSSTIINNFGGEESIELSSGNLMYMFNTIFWNSGKINIKWNNTVYLSNTLLQNGMDGIEIEYTGNNVYSSGPVFDANPYFMDSLDYHLADWSPAIGAGADSVEMNGLWFYSPITDFDGNPRPSPSNTYPDLGAFENMLGLPVGIADRETDNKSDIKIFPNPASTYCCIIFPIQFTEKAHHFTVCNINGKTVEERNISDHQNSIYLDVSDYPSGIYTVVYRADDSNLNLGKFIVRHNQ